MALATWWRSDLLPHLSTVPGFGAQPATDDLELAELNRIPVEEVRARRQAGHRPYIGSLHGVAVAYGWVATRAAGIGELDVTLSLTPNDRYLWDFATLPAWQGRGLYPRLLQAILQQESTDAERFWIIYAPENLPSGAGMHKAGFRPVAELSFDADYDVRLTPLGPVDRAQVAAELLGVPLVDDPLAPCWGCHDGEASACWPQQEQASQACTCAIERHSGRELPTPAQQERYEIRVRGHVSAGWSEWFNGLMITNLDGGDTLISGTLPDQAALHGVLAQLHSLNLPLLGVQRVEPPANQRVLYLEEKQ